MRTITLPLALPAIAGGFILAFLETLVLFGAPAMLAIPARFRAQLEGGAVLSRWIDGCLAIHTRAGWDALSAKVSGVALTDPAGRRHVGNQPAFVLHAGEPTDGRARRHRTRDVVEAVAAADLFDDVDLARQVGPARRCDGDEVVARLGVDLDVERS